MKITVDHDSALVDIYYRADKEHWGTVVEVPDDVFERYERAEAEYDTAKSALDEAITAVNPKA